MSRQRATAGTCISAGLLLLISTLISVAPATAAEGTYRYERKGLDRCIAPSHAQMADFYNGTQWWWWGIYIGGVSVGCDSGLSASWIDTEVTRGWGLLPIWVGRQAPCTAYAHRFSSNTSTARDQGWDTAQNALAEIGDLGMNSDTPIVLDLEPFDANNSSCLAAAKAYVKGWSDYLLQPPAQSPGVYALACNSGLTSFWSISPRPVFAWGAYWDGIADVYNLGCLASNIWPKRHKQYYGDVQRTENGTTLTVDVNCAQGPMYAAFGDKPDTVCR
jgi:hypothetical protein